MRIPAVNLNAGATGSCPGWHRVVLAPAALRRWLLDDGSLTQRLKQVSRLFRVVRLAQRRARVCIDEVACIRPSAAYAAAVPGGRLELPRGILPGSPRGLGYLVREVLLECDGSPAVFAHSVIDAQALRGRWRWLAGLGARPLGEALFRDPRVRRGPLAFRRLRAPDRRYQRAAAELSARGEPVPSSLWARRSVFRAGGRQLLVTEVFLPAVAALTAAASSAPVASSATGRAAACALSRERLPEAASCEPAHGR